MPKTVVSYRLMVAHSGDTSEFVSIVKEAANLFCKEYSKYNENEVFFDVKDYNDATYSTYNDKGTQTVVFEQFAGYADLMIALIGKRIGAGLRDELKASKLENKQTFVYLYNAGIPYDIFNPMGANSQIEQDVKNVIEIANEFANIGFAKTFSGKEQLIQHIFDDLGRFLKHRRSVNYELKDPSYRQFALNEVERYRKEIALSIEEKRQLTQRQISTSLLDRIEEHARTNISELMHLLKEMISEKYQLDITDITVSFVWGYHDPDNHEEVVIIPSQDNVIVLNHAGAPAKLVELLKAPNSLLRHMLVTGANYKWYQHKSYAYQKGHYYWSINEYRDRKRAQTENTDSQEEWGGSIFCNRIILNGDGSSTSSYAVGFVMASTYERPFTNTAHDEIREQVKQTIGHMIDFRIKPQLLVEMAQLYLTHLNRATQEVGSQENKRLHSVESKQQEITEIEQEIIRAFKEYNNIDK